MTASFKSTPSASYELPEHFPSISVSLEVGDRLRKQGRVVEVDPYALNEALGAVGVQDKDFDKVDFSLKTLESGTLGETAYQFHSERFALNIDPTKKKMRNRNSHNLTHTIVHESQHIYDYLNMLEKGGKNLIKRRIFFDASIPFLGGIALMAGAGLASEAIRSHIEDPPVALTVSIMGGIAMAAALYSGRKLTEKIAYATSPMEKRARRAEDKHTSIEHIVTFPKLKRN